MDCKWLRAISMGACFFILATASFSAERLSLSDKSIPARDQIEKCLPDQTGLLELEPDSFYEEPLILTDLPSEPELARTLMLEQINHPRVNYYMDYFTGPFRSHFQTWLERSGYYREYIEQQLREHQLPESLFYLAFIESGLNPYAFSRAGAGGIWQFMPRTAERFGLKVDFWQDDRRDLDKSTEAAISYLTELYQRFGSWPLAVASYNAGEGKVARAMNRYETEDYWELIEYRCLKRETRDYLPKMIAASIIVENPEKYGFTPPQKVEMVRDDFEIIELQNPVDLNKAAKYIGAGIEELRRMNPSVRRDISPPGSNYKLHIPVGTREQFTAVLAKLKPEQNLNYYRHRVRRGETLSEICQKYGASLREIRQVNHISGSFIRAGQVLIIPVPTPGYRSKPRVAAAAAPAKTPPKPVAAPAGKVTIRYKAIKGDTLWDISQAAQVDVASIKGWNKIGSKLSPGQELVLYLTPAQAGKFQAWAKKAGRQLSAAPKPSLATIAPGKK